MRELVRMHEDLGQEVVALGNRLREQLHRFYPQVLELGSVYHESWLWELLALSSNPEQARYLSTATICALLKRHRIRRVDAHEVIETIRSAPLQVAPGVVAAGEQHIMRLLPRLRLAYTLRRQCEKDIETLLDKLGEPVVDDKGNVEHSDATILRSMPGVGTIVGSTILAEASQLLGERDLTSLRAQSGTAPVTRQSGKSKLVSMRRARNPRLQQAMYHWSRTNVQHDSRSKEQYARLRAAGHRHGRALRGVCDRLLDVLIAMLRNRELYDPRRRLGTLDHSESDQPCDRKKV